MLRESVSPMLAPLNRMGILGDSDTRSSRRGDNPLGYLEEQAMKVLKRRFIPRKRDLEFKSGSTDMSITVRQWWIWDNLLKSWVSMANSHRDCSMRAKKLNDIHLRVIGKLAA